MKWISPAPVEASGFGVNVRTTACEMVQLPPILIAAHVSGQHCTHESHGITIVPARNDQPEYDRIITCRYPVPVRSRLCWQSSGGKEDQVTLAGAVIFCR